MHDILRRAPLVVEAVLLQRPVHGLDDVVALAKRPQRAFGLVGDHPAARLDLARQAEVLQCLRPIDQQVAVAGNGVAVAGIGTEVDQIMLLLFGDQHAVEPCQPFGVHLVGQHTGDLELTLQPEFPFHQLACPVADAMGDVVAGDVQDLAVIGDAAHQDVGVRMTGVVVVDGDPVEARVKVCLHLPHEIAGEGAQVLHLRGILRRDDEAELVPVAAAALDEGLAVGLVLDGRVHPALLPVPGDAVALDIAQMRIDGLARRHEFLAAPALLPLLRQLDDARLHHDAAGMKADAIGVLLPPAAVLRQACCHPAAAAAGIEAATLFPGPAACGKPIGIAALLADGNLDLAHKGQRARIDRSAAPGPAGANLEPFAVTICHYDSIGSQIPCFKMAGAPSLLRRAKTCCGVEAPIAHHYGTTVLRFTSTA